MPELKAIHSYRHTPYKMCEKIAVFGISGSDLIAFIGLVLIGIIVSMLI